MKFLQKLSMTSKELLEHGAVNIVFLGDSVTHGVLDGENNYETVYWNILKKRLNNLYNYIPINAINSGIEGTTAKNALERINRDVLSYHPELVVVCFGLNDINGELNEYTESLSDIFKMCKKIGADVIFMTPNMLNTYVAKSVLPQYREIATTTAKYQNEGKMDEYIKAAIKTAEENEVIVCDCYAKWKEMYQSGADTTELLINKINHPNQKMHQLFADMLFDIIMMNETGISAE